MGRIFSEDVMLVARHKPPVHSSTSSCRRNGRETWRLPSQRTPSRNAHLVLLGAVGSRHFRFLRTNDGSWYNVDSVVEHMSRVTSDVFITNSRVFLILSNRPFRCRTCATVPGSQAFLLRQILAAEYSARKMRFDRSFPMTCLLSQQACHREGCLYLN